MDKDKFGKLIRKTHMPLNKDFINVCLILGLIANVVLYYFFRNIVETVISGVLFVALAVVLFRNRHYLRDYDSSLLVKTCISGYVFWMLLVFTFMFQLKFEINFWLFISELILLCVSFLLAKNSIDKVLKEDKYIIDFEGYEKAPKVGAVAAGLVYSLSLIFHPPISENMAWYILSLICFGFVLLSSYMFFSNLYVYVSFLKYYSKE